MEQYNRSLITTMAGEAVEILSGQPNFMMKTKTLVVRLLSELGEQWNDTREDNDPTVEDLAFYNRILSL